MEVIIPDTSIIKKVWTWDSLENAEIWKKVDDDTKTSYYAIFVFDVLQPWLITYGSTQLDISVVSGIFTINNAQLLNVVACVKLFSLVNQKSYTELKQSYRGYLCRVIGNNYYNEDRFQKCNIADTLDFRFHEYFFNNPMHTIHFHILTDLIATSETNQKQQYISISEHTTWKVENIDGDLQVDINIQHDSLKETIQRLIFLFYRIFYFMKYKNVGYMIFSNCSLSDSKPNALFFLKNKFQILESSYLHIDDEKNTTVYKKLIVKQLISESVKTDNINKTILRLPCTLYQEKLPKNNDDNYAELHKKFTYLETINKLQKDVLISAKINNNLLHIKALNSLETWSRKEKQELEKQIATLKKEKENIIEERKLAESAQIITEDRLKNTVRPLHEKIERLEKEQNSAKHACTLLESENTSLKEQCTEHAQQREIDRIKFEQEQKTFNNEKISNQKLTDDINTLRGEKEEQVRSINKLQTQIDIVKFLLAEQTRKNKTMRNAICIGVSFLLVYCVYSIYFSRTPAYNF
jgi:hypothetical protein